MRYNREVAKERGPRASDGGATYEASDSPALAALVKAAQATGLGSVSIAYRRTAGQVQAWASTHHEHRGWEALGPPLERLASEVAKDLVAKEDGWGQIEVDVVGGRAEAALVKAAAPALEVAGLA